VFAYHGFRVLQFFRRQADHYRHRLGAGEIKPDQTHHPAVSTIMTQETNIHTQTIINKSWNVAKGSFDYLFSFTFQGRDQYLAFRQQWKANYAVLSRTIRSQKAEIKAISRKLEYAGLLQSKSHELRHEATRQLLMRKAAKEESHRQYLAAKQTIS